MEFLKLAQDRFSMRKFDTRPLDDKDINLILTAAKLAPTAKNIQPQRILVLKSDEALKKLNDCTPCGFGSKTAFLLCYDKNLSWKRSLDGSDSGLVDIGIIATHMMLMATSIGAGTTLVMNFNAEKAVKEFSLPENLIPGCFIVAGYPAVDTAPADRHDIRKSIDEFSVEI